MFFPSQMPKEAIAFQGGWIVNARIDNLPKMQWLLQKNSLVAAFDILDSLLYFWGTYKVTFKRSHSLQVQSLDDAYAAPANFLEIDVINPITHGMGNKRYTDYECRLKVSKKSLGYDFLINSNNLNDTCSFTTFYLCITTFWYFHCGLRLVFTAL